MEKMTVCINNINKIYDRKIILQNFNIKFYLNKINTIVGKSGCGKSTLLNIISGVINNDTLGINELTDLGISYIFQDDRLVEWLTVKENIKLVCNRKYNKEDIDSLCDKYLGLVGISEYKDYYPQMLSGGLRQRVNITRALMYPSKVIIMDEPFKSIDIKNKKDIMIKIKEIQKKENRTIIFVTHDIDEALFLSDKIYVLGDRPLRIRQILDNNDKLTKENIFSII